MMEMPRGASSANRPGLATPALFDEDVNRSMLESPSVLAILVKDKVQRRGSARDAAQGWRRSPV